jgi:hypothetical protein
MVHFIVLSIGMVILSSFDDNVAGADGVCAAWPERTYHSIDTNASSSF